MNDSPTNRIEPNDFWRWAYSDFLSNSLRGVLAEFIVARALGCEQRPRKEWDSVDLVTDSGLRIEVKSAAYLQTWTQTAPSAIRFDIAKKKGWDAETNVSSAEASRAADVYVFCVFAATEKPADPLDLSEWFFLVATTRTLDERFGAQKSVALSSLESLGLRRVSACEIPDEVAELGASINSASKI